MKVKLNSANMARLNDWMIEALEMTAEQTMTDIVTAQVMPFDVGTLQNESTSVDRSEIKQGKARIVSNTPYARRLYFHPEYNFNTANNPNARGKWLDEWADGKYTERIQRNYAQFLKRVGGL